jgi:hypothetical protein
MKYFLSIMAALCLPLASFCQDITGLWKGTMYNDSTKISLPYEIVINKENGKYTGFSQSWFLIEGKQYYGIKKIKVRVAKDGKIVMQDAALIDNNYPVSPDKNVNQLNILDLASHGEEIIMDGPFVTNRTKKFKELTGHIYIKRVSILSESTLMEYLQKNGSNNGLTAVK